MKLLIVLFSVSLSGQALCERPSRGYDDQVQKQREECSKELQFENSDFDHIDDSPPQGKAKCFMRCMAQKADIMNEKGDLNVDEINKKFNPHDNPELKKTIATCLAIVNEDICIKAYDIHICLFNSRHPGNGMQGKVFKLMKECSNELKIELPKFEHGHRPPPVDENMKCVKACVAEKLGWLDANAKIVEEELKKAYQIDSSKNITECLKISNENKCEKAWLVEKCVEPNMKMRRE